MFPLGDHAFYVFREILGYRLGTILNYIAMMVSYFQILYLLSAMTKNYIFARVLSFISILPPMVLQCFAGTYYTDLLVLPFLLEILIINIIPTMSMAKVNISKFLYIALMAGLAIAIKMTSLPFLCSLILCIYIKELNVKFKYYHYYYALLILIFPCVSYMLYNFVETGNPIFPIYNAIFRSPFYEYVNRMDCRFGAENFIELVMWPLYMIIYPTYRSGSIPTTINLHYIIYFVVLLISLYKKKNIKLSLICILSLYLWAATTKENRYFCYGEVFFNILVSISILKFEIKRFIPAMAIFLSWAAVLPLGLYQVIYLGHAVTVGGKLNYAKWEENIEYVFHDRHFISEQMSNKIDVWIINNEDSMGLAAAMSKKPVISKQYEKRCNATAKNEVIAMEKDINAKYKGDIADVHLPFETVEPYINTLNENGYYIKSIDYADGDVFLEKKPWICMIDKSTRKNEMYNLVEKSFSLDMDKTGNFLLLKYILGLRNDYFWDSRLYPVIVSVADDNGYTNITAYNLTKDNWINEEKKIDITEAAGKLHIEISVGGGMDDVRKDWILLVNPQISFVRE